MVKQVVPAQRVVTTIFQAWISALFFMCVDRVSCLDPGWVLTLCRPFLWGLYTLLSHRESGLVPFLVPDHLHVSFVWLQQEGLSVIQAIGLKLWCLWLSNPTSGHIPWENYNWKGPHTPMFTAALFAIAKTWKQPRCPSAGEWIRKMRYINATEYYSAIKRNEVESFVAMWMDLESVIQNAVSQKEENKCHELMHICGI